MSIQYQITTTPRKKREPVRHTYAPLRVFLDKKQQLFFSHFHSCWMVFRDGFLVIADGEKPKGEKGNIVNNFFLFSLQQ